MPGNAGARRNRSVVPTLIAAAVSALSVSGIPFDSPLAARGLAQSQAPAKGPDIHFVATPQPVADAMLKLARVTPDDVVYDLGSGDGRIVVLAAQKYGARGVGIEIDARLVELSRQVAREGEVDDRVRFEQGDLFAADLSRATVVTLWLSETVNARLEEKLKRELRPGARVVSHQFPIGKWMPEKQIVAHGEDVYLWIIKN
jgi:cyclopropane fatty-acyl-phospholipid synthase-like methyltransferase